MQVLASKSTLCCLALAFADVSSAQTKPPTRHASCQEIVAAGKEDIDSDPTHGGLHDIMARYLGELSESTCGYQDLVALANRSKLTVTMANGILLIKLPNAGFFKALLSPEQYQGSREPWWLRIFCSAPYIFIRYALNENGSISGGKVTLGYTPNNAAIRCL